MKRKKLLSGIIVVILLIVGYIQNHHSITSSGKVTAQRHSGHEVVIVFPKDRYPQTGQHIEDAIKKGEPNVCTIDREGVKENRRESLAHVPNKQGYDRDEWPMAMCDEGGAGANIEYISPADNRGRVLG